MLEITNDLAAAHGSTRCATASLAYLTQLQLATASGCGAAASGAPKQLQLTSSLRKARGRAPARAVQAKASVISDTLGGCGRVC